MPLAHTSQVVTRRRPPLVLLALVTAIAPATLHMLVPALPILDDSRKPVIVASAEEAAISLRLTAESSGGR